MKEKIRQILFLPLLAFLLVSALAVARQSEKDKTKSAKETPSASEEQELALGKELYDKACKGCHRSDGKGTLEEMDLTDNLWKHGNTPEDVEKVIREGIKGSGMRAIVVEHTDQQIKALVKYVLKFSADVPPAAPADPAKPPEPPKPPDPPSRTQGFAP